MKKARKYRGPKATTRIYFHDEAPQIGSGWRGITVRKEGRLWAHLTETGTQTNFRMSMKAWLELRKKERPV